MECSAGILPASRAGGTPARQPPGFFDSAQDRLPALRYRVAMESRLLLR
jgi:hypothetical protein